MHPSDCPPWNYELHPHANVVALRCEAVLNSLGKGQLPVDGTLRDTRAVHNGLFINLTPERCHYYAGHYRGEKFRCLRFLRVMVNGDPRVGVDPKRVLPELANFVSHVINPGIKAVDVAFAKPDAELPPEEKLFYLVVFATRALAEFLRIHPYCNGNGHIGRLIVWLLLVRYGFWPEEWPLDEHPPYDQLLSRFRDGDEGPLQKFVMRSIIGSS